MRSLVSRWPTELLLPVLVAGLETAAIAPLIHLVWTGFSFTHDSLAPWPAAIGAVGLVAFWSTRILALREFSLWMERVFSLAVWLATLVFWLTLQYGELRQLDITILLEPAQRYLAVPALLSLCAWWRGLTYASDPAPFSSDAVRAVVRTAWIALVLQLILAATLDNPAGSDALQSGQSAVPVAVICGLLAMAVAQLEQAQQSALRRQGRKPERRTWVFFAIGATALIIVMSMVVSGLLGKDAWSVLYEPVAFGLHWLSTGIFYALLALAFLIFLLLSPLIWLARYALNGSQPTEQVVSSPPSFGQFTSDAQSQLSPNVVTGLRWALVAIVVTLVVFIVLRSLRRYQAIAVQEEVDEERESLWSREMIEGQLRGLFGRHPGNSREKPLDLKKEPTSVRDAYRYLTVLAARHGDARKPSETPNTFSARMRDSWPDVDPEIADLTARYLRVRYGDMPDEPERGAAQADWRTIWRKYPLDDDSQ